MAPPWSRSRVRSGREVPASTRQRKLKIGSSTAPTDPVRSRRMASGSSVSSGASEKRRPVGFELNRSRGADQHVRDPHGRIVRRARRRRAIRTPSDSAARFRRTSCERGMRGIGAMRSQRQFHVAGELEWPAPRRAIGDRHAPQFHVVFGGDGDLHDGFDPGSQAPELRAVRRKSWPNLRRSGRPRADRRPTKPFPPADRGCRENFPRDRASGPNASGSDRIHSSGCSRAPELVTIKA